MVPFYFHHNIHQELFSRRIPLLINLKGNSSIIDIFVTLFHLYDNQENPNFIFISHFHFFSRKS